VFLFESWITYLFSVPNEGGAAGEQNTISQSAVPWPSSLWWGFTGFQQMKILTKSYTWPKIACLHINIILSLKSELDLKCQ